MNASGGLDRIKGVGPATAAWLASTFGVHTPAELAGLDPDDIESRLRRERRPGITRPTVERWLADARALEAGDDPPERADDVRLTSFVVEFSGDRTAVHHVEGDDSACWEGCDPGPVTRWMAERLPAPTAEVVTDPPVTRPPGVLLLDAAAARDGDRVVVFDWRVDGGDLPAGDWLLDVVFVPVTGSGPALRARPDQLVVAAPAGARAHRVRLAAQPPQEPPSTALHRATALLTFRPAGSRRPVLAASADVGVVDLWSEGARAAAGPSR